MRRRTILQSLLLATAGTGCVQVLGTFGYQSTGGASSSSTSTTSGTAGGSSSTSSGTGGSTTTGTGGGCAARDVNGTETEWFLANGVMTPTKPDLSQAKITVLSGPNTITGVGNANGTFKVSGVPCGEYYLTYVDPGVTPSVAVYYLTSSDTPDMSRWVAGRSNVTAMTSSTKVTVSLTGLDAWTSTDALKLASINVGIADVDLVSATSTTPASGATTFTGTFDASQVFSPPNLIEASQSDHLVLFQRENQVQGAYTCNLVARSVNLGNFTMSNGTPVTVAPALSALAQTKSATINWATTQYEKLAPAVNPNATVGGHYYTLTGYLGVPTDGSTGASTDLLSFTAPNGTDVTNAKLTFGDPFSGLTYVEQANTTFLIPVTAPTAKSSTNVTVYARYYAPQATFEGQTVAPLVSPVTSLVVDGKPGFGGGTLSSTTPTISFSAPATGTPTHYTVQAIQLGTTASGGTTATDVGEIWGKSMSIQLPENLLVGGSAYVFRIDALTFPGSPADAEAEPRWIPFPYAFAETLSGVFTTP